jgi:hypothetical protein
MAQSHYSGKESESFGSAVGKVFFSFLARPDTSDAPAGTGYETHFAGGGAW